MDFVHIFVDLYILFNNRCFFLNLYLKEKKIIIERSGSWHRELLEQAFENKIISDKTKTSLKEYLLFRHFFVHAYALDLYEGRMEKLVDNIEATYNQFKIEIDRFTTDKQS